MRFLTFASCLCGVAFLALASAQAPPAESPDGLPDAPGKATLLRICSECHGVNLIAEAAKTADEWNDSLSLMEAFGAYAAPDEWKDVEGYLVGHLAVVHVNAAPAVELQAFFDISGTAAAAIVAAREGKPFETVDEVKKVEGVDPAKIDARKARVVF
jgi:hypothetical protein